MFMARVQPRGHATSACHLSMPPQHMPPQPAGASSDPPPTCLPPPLPAAWRRRHSGVHAGQRPPHEVWVWQPRPGQPPVHQLGAREVPGGRAGTAPWPAEEACGETGGDRAGQGGPGLPGIASAVQPRPCLLKLQSVHSCVVGGTQVGVDSPGPSYNLPAGMGRQQVSGRTGWLPAACQAAVCCPGCLYGVCKPLPQCKMRCFGPAASVLPPHLFWQLPAAQAWAPPAPLPTAVHQEEPGHVCDAQGAALCGQRCAGGGAEGGGAPCLARALPAMRVALGMALCAWS